MTKHFVLPTNTITYVSRRNPVVMDKKIYNFHRKDYKGTYCASIYQLLPN